MIRLTSKATVYRWHDFGEYHYTDDDNLASDPIVKERVRKERIEKGLPRYSIAFRRKANKRKYPVYCFLGFDDFGEYVGIDVRSAGATKKEIRAWESEALKWLTENGVIRGREEK